MDTNIVMQLKLRAVSKGVSLTKVCDMAGINRGVLSHWAKSVKAFSLLPLRNPRRSCALFIF